MISDHLKSVCFQLNNTRHSSQHVQVAEAAFTSSSKLSTRMGGRIPPSAASVSGSGVGDVAAVPALAASTAARVSRARTAAAGGVLAGARAAFRARRMPATAPALT